MPLILVTPLSAVPDVLGTFGPSHLISLLSPAYMIDTPAGFPAERHLRLAVMDVADAGLGDPAPAAHHVAQLFEFAAGWDGSKPLLVHCWAGVSRSMASAFAILCSRTKPGQERTIAREIRNRAPHAQPNPLIVRHADAYLGRNGAMIRAVEEIGPGVPVDEGEVVHFPLRNFI